MSTAATVSGTTAHRARRFRRSATCVRSLAPRNLQCGLEVLRRTVARGPVPVWIFVAHPPAGQRQLGIAPRLPSPEACRLVAVTSSE